MNRSRPSRVALGALVLAIATTTASLAAARRPARRGLDPAVATTCLGGYAPACDEAARSVARPHVRPDDPASIEATAARARWLALGCDFGSRDACLQLARAFEEGSPLADAAYFERTSVGADLSRASRYYEEACGLGEVRACARAVDAYSTSASPCDARRVARRVCDASPRDVLCASLATLDAACRATTAMPLPAPEPE